VKLEELSYLVILLAAVVYLVVRSRHPKKSKKSGDFDLLDPGGDGGGE
jgi:hypothetical protein